MGLLEQNLSLYVVFTDHLGTHLTPETEKKVDEDSDGTILAGLTTSRRTLEDTWKD